MILTVGQFAEKAKLKKATVRDLLCGGFLKGARQGKRTWGILLDELEKWLSSRDNQRKGADSK